MQTKAVQFYWHSKGSEANRKEFLLQMDVRVWKNRVCGHLLKSQRIKGKNKFE